MLTSLTEKIDDQPQAKNNNFDRTQDTKYYSEDIQPEDLQSENARLRLLVLDLQLKQRDYVAKILQLETDLAIVNLQVSTQQNDSKKKRASIQTSMKKGDILKLRQFHQDQNKQNKSINSERLASDEKKFCDIVVKTYSDLFAISSLKQIWKKHKQILQDWLLSENKDKK